MRCISKCKYYGQHDFMGSYHTCGLNYHQGGWSEEVEHSCIIDKKIKEMETELAGLRKYRIHIVRTGNKNENI